MALFTTTIPHKEGTVIELFGERFTMEPAGDYWRGSLETETERVIARLRQIPEGFAEVGAQVPPGAFDPVTSDGATEAGKPADGETPDEPADDPKDEKLNYVFENETGATIDLSGMKIAELRHVAEEAGITLPEGLTKTQVRDFIAKALVA